MCDAQHTVACLSHCDVKSLSWDSFQLVIVLCVMIVWGHLVRYSLLLRFSDLQSHVLSMPLFLLSPELCKTMGGAFLRICDGFCASSVPWLFQPFWRTNQVYYPGSVLGWPIALHTGVIHVSGEQIVVIWTGTLGHLESRTRYEALE